MAAPEIVLLVTFLIILILVTLEKIEKVVGGVLGAVIVFLILFLTERFLITDIIEFIDFGVILTILGIFVSVEAISESGFFQWLAIKGIKATKGHSTFLFVLLCFVASILTGFITAIASMIIVGALTVDIAKILDIDPTPYLTAEAITVNCGTLLTPIASIPNIIVLGEIEEASFGFYAVNLAPISLLLITSTVFILLKLTERLEEPSDERRAFLMEFNSWVVVPNRPLFNESAILFIAMTVSLIILPNLFPLVKLWFVAVLFMLIFLALPETNGGELIKNIEWGTIFFLIGLFVMVEGLAHKGLLLQAAEGMRQIIGGNRLLSILIILSFSFFASGVIDNIAVTIALLPILSHLLNIPALQAINNILISTLIIGANLGGNLTPMASPTTVLAMSISKKSDYELTPRKFIKIGFPTTMIQLFIATAYLLLIYSISTFLMVNLLLINLLMLLFALVGFAALYFRETLQQKLSRAVHVLSTLLSKFKVVRKEKSEEVLTQKFF